MIKADFSKVRLYGILDLAYVDVAEIPRVAAAMIEGGVDIMQLRAKKLAVADVTLLAGELHGLARSHNIPLIINDHPEVARLVPLEGVHVGQDDPPIAEVRKIVGRSCVVGKSSHSLAQAVAAPKEGADYIGFGPIFATPTKPDYAPVGLTDIRAVHAAVPVPVFCIGGIKRDNLKQVIAAGAQRVVIVSGLLQADDIVAYARACKEMLKPL